MATSARGASWLVPSPRLFFTGCCRRPSSPPAALPLPRRRLSTADPTSPTAARPSRSPPPAASLGRRPPPLPVAGRRPLSPVPRLPPLSAAGPGPSRASRCASLPPGTEKRPLLPDPFSLS
nr:uncharacterized protein LOC127339740 [Lolium perenne]